MARCDRHILSHLVFLYQVCLHHFLLLGDAIGRYGIIEVPLHHQAGYRAAIAGAKSCILYHYSDCDLWVVLRREACENRVVVPVAILYRAGFAAEAYTVYF